MFAVSRRSAYKGQVWRRLSSVIQNVQVRLAKRPIGKTSPDCFSIHREDVPNPTSPGDILVQVSEISIDPAMRGWMNDVKSYIRPIGIGEVFRANGVGNVVASNNPDYMVGDVVMGGFGVQKYSLLTAKDIPRAGITKIDLNLGTQQQWLNVLGMPGMTAYFGLKDVGLPKAGETIVISAAAGAVGQTVGQLAKVLGLRTVGIAGGPEKCTWVVKTLGFDACIDYKDSPSSVRDGLKTHCPSGIDIYFDNVGGDILDHVLARINRQARVVICGAVSQYNTDTHTKGPKNYLSLLVNRARMEGMVVFDYADRYAEAVRDLSGLMKNGQITSREHVEEGIEKFPETLDLLFAGKNFGKLILKV